jgi:hypothetical protein
MEPITHPPFAPGEETLRRQVAQTYARYLALIAHNSEPCWDTFRAVAEDEDHEAIYEVWDCASDLGFFDCVNYRSSVDFECHEEVLRDRLCDALSAFRSLVLTIGVKS